MADTVVGRLRTLLTLDTASFVAESKTATTAANSLDKSLTELGKETERLSARGERLVKSFGGEKLLAQANELTAAVAKFGGVSKLTAAEQTRINATVTTAIEKYRALGQQAPRAMLELQAATKGATAASTTFGISLRQLQTVAATFGISLGAGALIAFGRDLLQVGDELVRVADRTGLTTTEVQKLQFIAKQSGNSLEELTSAVGNLQNRLAGGDKGTIAAIEKLGINLDKLKAASPFEQLAMISDAMRKIEDPAIRARREFELFGRSGIAITPTLIAQFRELGNQAPIMAEKTVRALDRIGDELSKSKDQIKAWAADAFVVSFDFASHAFDRFVIIIQRGTAAVIDAQANMLEILAKIPGVGLAFQKLGINIAEQRKQADFLRESAHALELGLSRVEPEIRKNVIALGDYEDSTKDSSKALKEHEKAAEDAAKAQRDFVNFLGEREIEDAAAATRALAESTKEQEAADRAYRQFLNQIGEQEIADHAAQLQERLALDKSYQKLLSDTENERGKALMEADRKRMKDRGEIWKSLQKNLGSTLEQLNTAVAGSFAQMALGAKRFKDAFIDIWQSIKAALIRIFAEIAGAFVKGMLKKMIASVAGTAAAGAIGAAAGGGAAAAVSGVESAALGGTAAAGGSSTLLALATNPWTIGIAAGIGGFLLARHFFGGGEEVKVNPRRDQFTAQFGGGTALAALLTAQSGKPGGGPLFAALQGADKIASFEAAEKAILAFETNHGKRNVKLFNMGGFVPPGAIQPAILHGGNFGEDIVPRGTSGATSVSLTLNISAIDAKGVRDFVESRDFTDSLDRAFVHNKRFLATRIRSSLT